MSSVIKVNTLQDAGGNSLLVSDGSGSITTNNINVKDIDWQAVVTSNTTMVAGRGYFVDTSSSAITMTLPASPSIGDTIEVVDIGEEEEKNGKESSKDLDVKNYYSTDNSSLYNNLEKKKQISFYSKNYTSYQDKLISPPPEFLF